MLSFVKIDLKDSSIDYSNADRFFGWHIWVILCSTFFWFKWNQHEPTNHFWEQVNCWSHFFIANLRYPAKNKFFAGERRYSHWYQKTQGLKYPSKIDLDTIIDYLWLLMIVDYHYWLLTIIGYKLLISPWKLVLQDQILVGPMIGVSGSGAFCRAFSFPAPSVTWWTASYWWSSPEGLGEMNCWNGSSMILKWINNRFGACLGETKIIMYAEYIAICQLHILEGESIAHYPRISRKLK